MAVTYPQLDETIRAILQDAVRREGSIAAVARRLNYTRSAISQALSGRYPADAGKLGRLIFDTFAGVVVCPHLAIEIEADDCRWWRTRPIPTSRASDANHWLACKTCPLNPDRKDPKPCSA